MAFLDLFGTGEHLSNLSHFAAIVNIAAVDGEINNKEEEQLRRFATKLDIREDEYESVLKNPAAYPIDSPSSSKKRLKRLHDLLTIIYSDHQIDNEELHLLRKYAIGLGFSQERATAIIKKSVEIFNGKLGFKDYRHLVTKK